MTRGDSLRPAGAWALGLALFLAMHSCKAQAQDAETLALARVCASETVERSPVAVRHAECRQIAWATAERAVMHGRSYLAELRAYSPRATGVERYEGREWLPALHPDRLPGVRHVNAEALRWRFVALLMVARAALAGPNEPGCLGLEWGSPSCAACRARMRAAGYVRVSCVGANAWWGPA